MAWSFRNTNGASVKFNCDLEDNVSAMTDDGIVFGKVVALDDDGYVTIETITGEEVRVYNDSIL